MKRRAEHEPGFVLHSYPYKETSLIIEAFTRGYGRVGLLARGARRPRSMMRGVLLAFHPLRMSWSTSTELGTLMAAEWGGGQPCLSGISLMCGFYINELLLRLLPRDDPHEALFDAYGVALARLAAGEAQAAVLRGFERRMLAELGYAPVLDRDAANGAQIEATKHYAYEAERGMVESRRLNGDSVFSGRTLLDMVANNYEHSQTREEARRLMRALITERLGGQTLHTRVVLAELQDL
ncbi:MAG: DNA repair protein RecO [Betaproteobacteria bacterium]|nr:DNA repair protein RecO [Betaproteobacteria bacterium]MSQ88763.1 DNA repair protein RecO [Betaproteobacteria bacterium]